MYADRIEAEARSVKTRISGGSDRALGAVRGQISFKRTGIQTRARGRSSLDEKWQHDLFEGAETLLQPQGSSGDLRAFLASKQQAKLGPSRNTRLSGRVGSAGLSTAKAAVLAASDLRQQLSTAPRRKAGRPTARRKPAGGGGVVGNGAAVQKRITVTLRNDEGMEEEEEEVEEEEEERGIGDAGAAAVGPTVVRGGRGSLLVTSNLDEEDEGMDVDAGPMPGQPPLPVKRSTRSGAKGSGLGQDDVAPFLASLGLSKYTATFAAEEIDMHALLQMREDDLKELGIPMGPRKKILLAAESL